MLVMLVLGLSVSAFAEEKTYIYEEGIVTYETAYEALDMMIDASEPMPFSDFAEIRDCLYEGTIDGYCVDNVTLEGLKDLLIPWSYSRGRRIIDCTKSLGFSLNLYYYDDRVLWICTVERDLLYKIGD